MCVFYDGVALIVIPDCIEAIIFYAKIVAAEHIEVREQIQSLKLVIAYILLVLVIGNVNLNKVLDQNWGKPFARQSKLFVY